MFARLRLQRLSSFSSRFVPVERVVLHRSPIRMTPYREDGSIDGTELAAFVDGEYAAAGLAHDDVDTGAVILTGSALETRNAAEIADAFARHGGAFVCATAGHRLEAVLAAYGSGAVARSRRDGVVALNVDVGGGTTKLALLDRGELIAASAIRVGARSVPRPPDEAGRAARAREMARAIVSAAASRPVDETLRLLPPLPPSPRPSVVTFSGGVGELMLRPTHEDLGDLGPELAAALRALVSELPGTLEAADEGIRATVIGASQYSVQLSGNTVHISDERRLPLRNIPVAVARTRRDRSDAAAIRGAVRDAIDRSGHHGSDVLISVPFSGEPRYADLRALAEGLHGGVGDGRLMAAVSGDVARSIGRILTDELGRSDVLVLDGLELSDLDYVDVGEVVRPAGVVPVVVKTLLFEAGAA
ncbi:MAG TPA: ethanolamine ammonia-lyase reactivating factor EutA [Candidatus Limnocylindria bacterium]